MVGHRLSAGLMCLCAPGAAAGQTGMTPEDRPRHPVMTEILFNVPQGDGGDANRDGTRSAIGDEFVELHNPHDVPLELRGYRITNRITTHEPASKRGVRFEFPDCTLEPGQVALVFNGHESSLGGAAGDAQKCPPGAHLRFGGAIVFDMEMSSRFRAFSNSGDFVMLADPEGNPVEVVMWGEPEPGPPQRATVVRDVPKDPKGSVQRPGGRGEWMAHPKIDGRAFSPGELP